MTLLFRNSWFWITQRKYFPNTPRNGPLLTAIFLIVPFSLPASGRIGEDVWQCRTRYGKEVRVDDKNIYTFKKNGFIIEIEFEDGKAVLVTIEKIKVGIRNHFTREEVQTLLTANQSTTTWLPDETVKNQRDLELKGGYWKTADEKMEAFYLNSNRCLMIGLKAYNIKNEGKRLGKGIAVPAPKSVEGF